MLDIDAQGCNGFLHGQKATITDKTHRTISAFRKCTLRLTFVTRYRYTRTITEITKQSPPAK